METKKRIEYIDAMRGFTMLLVVCVHIQTFCYDAPQLKSFNQVFQQFFMPLFFFISGWVLSPDKMLGGVTLFLENKFRVLIVTTFIFMAILGWVTHTDVHTAFRASKLGYWFTFTLFFYYVFFAVSASISKIAKCNEMIILFVLAGLIYLLSCLDDVFKGTFFENIFAWLSIGRWRYYLFFCFGVFVKRYYSKFVLLTDSSRYFLPFIIGNFFFMVLFCDTIKFPFWTHISKIIYGVLGIILTLTYFRRNKQLFSSETKIGSGLQYIGKRTLDIYMLHYFFLPRNLTLIGTILTKYNNPTLEFFLSSLITMMVIIVSLVISNIIRLSPDMAYFLFGVKRK